MVFTDGSTYVDVADQFLDDWCYRIQVKNNKKINGFLCDNRLPYICQIKTSMVYLV